MNLAGLFGPLSWTPGRLTLPAPCTRTRSSLPLPLSQRLSTSHFPKGFGKPQFLLPTQVRWTMLCLLQLLHAVCKTRTVPGDVKVQAPHVIECSGRKMGAPRRICRSICSGRGFSPGSTNRDAGKRGKIDLSFTR